MADLRLFDATLRNEWDALVSSSLHGARQHSRGFLDYHGDYFTDCSLLLMDGMQLVAVFPAATNRDDSTQVISHPGAAYGGLVRSPGIPSSRVPELTRLVLRHYESKGFKSLVVRPTWPWLTNRADETFVHELIRAGAVGQPWQLISTVRLGEAPVLSSRRRRMLSRARSAVTLRWGLEHLASFWGVLEQRLWESHSALPVHSAKQVQDIAISSPSFVHLLTAWSEQGEILAGSLMFAEDPYVHLQYMAATDRGKRLGAMDLIVASAMSFGETRGAPTLSLGSSIDPDDKSINLGLLEYKSEFGSSTLAVPLLHLRLGG